MNGPHFATDVDPQAALDDLIARSTTRLHDELTRVEAKLAALEKDFEQRVAAAVLVEMVRVCGQRDELAKSLEALLGVGRLRWDKAVKMAEDALAKVRR